MEKHSVRLIPKIMNASMLFVCQFNDQTTGELVTLLDRGKEGVVKIGPLDTHERPKEIPLNVRSVIEFTFDKDNLADQNTKNYTSFWSKDIRVQQKGSLVNSSTAYLIMEDLSETITATVASIKDKRKATQKFETFGLRGWRNIAYYFGVPNADAMDEDQLYVHLIEPSNGVLVQPENIQRFLNYNSNDFLAQLAINVSRAIEKKFVEKRSVAGAGDSFFINNHPIGKTEADVIVYMEGNKDFYYQYIVEKLGDDAEMEKKVKAEETNKNIETIDVEGLRATCKERFLQLKALDVKGAKVAKYAQLTTAKGLQEAIAEADALIAERTVGKAGEKLQVEEAAATKIETTI